MPVTIRDLANQLGLSITTISRALDGYEDVATDTRARVIQAARAMGYEPSFAARQLRRKRSDAIGHIFPASYPSFADPFYSDFLTGLCDGAAAREVDLIVTSALPESDREQDQYRHWAQSGRVDGLIINRLRVQDWRIDYLLQKNVPFVALGLEGPDASYPGIFVAEREAFAELVRHLAGKGHRQIAFVGGPENLRLQVERRAGYLEGMASAGLEVRTEWMASGDLTEEGGSLAAARLLTLPRAPTAILGCNDLTSLGILRAAQERGYRIGSELAIAGYDGNKETAYTNPPLTTLSQPTYEIARQLAIMLVKLVKEGRLPDPVVTVKPQLILRASTEAS